MNDPENKDLKPQDDTAEQPTAAQQESDGTELSDEELGDAAGGLISGPVPSQSNSPMNSPYFSTVSLPLNEMQ